MMLQICRSRERGRRERVREDEKKDDDRRELVTFISWETWCTDLAMGSQRKLKIFDFAFIETTKEI